MSRESSRPWRSAVLGIGVLVALSALGIEPPSKKADVVDAATGQPVATATAPGAETNIGDPSAAADSPTGTATGGGGNASAGQSPKAAAAAKAGLACKAGQNGGSTDRGVSANRIKLAATNVRSGTGSSFLGSSYIGLQAVVSRVNAAGGICGRLLDLRLVDDGWDAARGGTFIANFAKDDYFALPVVPSSEGLTEAITNKTIDNAGIPVIGTDGMLKEQYNDPWVWPVATSTVSTIRVMTKYAADNGAKSFGIIYDTKYKFGIEGAAAFKTYVKALTGNDPKAYVGIEPGKGSYGGEAQQFNDQCGAGGCDFVAMLLTPETAITYIASQTDDNGVKQGFGKMMTGGAQPLFNERFARDCGRPCDGMVVWTGYNPPIGGLASTKDVAAYVDDVKSVDPGVDVNNQFLEGSYLGMKVFVAALQAAGPNLTRAGVRDAMNSMTFASSLSSPLGWTQTQRFANQAAQAFRIVTASGSFAGFAEVGTGFLKDPTPGVVPK